MKVNKIYYKIFINNILFLLLFITYIKNLFLINGIEKKIKHYIKFMKKKNIIKYYYEKDLPKIIKYVQLLRNASFINNIYHNYIDKPKISFVASVYNKEKYLNSLISSIQNQNMKEYELIFVDDCSNDESVNIIKKYMQKDKRIKLIKNKRNRGSLYTRYKGAQQSKGEFLIFVDSDDIVLKDGILRAYKYIKKNNLDAVQFNSVFEKKNSNIYISRRHYKYDNIIYQPILSYIFYYNKNYERGTESNTALWDKLIKREVVRKVFRFIGKKFINKKIIIENDVIILFSLFKNAKSFKYIDELGYYYFFTNKDSITKTRDNPLKANLIIYSIFSNIMFLYEKTGNSYFEKYFCLYKLEQGFNRYKKCFNYINKGNSLIKYVINRLLESKYISLRNKKKIKNIAKELIN